MGYLNASMDSFTKDGWFKTGDLVETTEDGYIKIIGRNKEVINVGGEKVLPSEVESIILSIPEIDDVMVYGEKNIITGQTVVCDVVLNNQIETKEIKKILRKYCKDKLAVYKIKWPLLVLVTHNTMKAPLASLEMSYKLQVHHISQTRTNIMNIIQTSTTTNTQIKL